MHDLLLFGVLLSLQLAYHTATAGHFLEVLQGDGRLLGVQGNEMISGIALEIA